MALTAIISKWGNSQGIRMPVEILKQADVSINDELYFDIDEKGRIVLSKAPIPKKGTLEYLFKDYEGGAFQTEIADMGGPVGEERW